MQPVGGNDPTATPVLLSESRPGWLFIVVRAGAIIGGLVFVALTAMLIVTIVGRKLFGWQVPGDVELVQMGAAAGAAPFFAWCHLVRGEVKVDFATNHLPRVWIASLDALGSVLVGLFGALLAWRGAALAIATYKGGEVSAILAWPMWIAQGLMVPGFILLALAGFHEALRSLRFRDRPPLIHGLEQGGDTP
jgi:TRAP-type C4-dicarboxylate transport system permease small subunit